MKLFLTRKYHATYTTGALSGNDGELICCALELPWKSNQRNVSCIPEGSYSFKPWIHGRFPAFKLEYVQNRTGILIHSGNILEHTEGCILAGMKPDGMRIWDSGAAMIKLSELYPDGGMIEIR